MAWTEDFWRRSGNKVSGGRPGSDSPGSDSISRTLTDVDAFYAVDTGGVTGPVGFWSQSNVVPGAGFIVNGTTAGSGAGSVASTSSTSSAAAISSAGGASPFVISVSYDSSSPNPPAWFVSAVNYVVSYYESVFTTSTTVNIDLGYGYINGQPLGSSQPGILGESETYIDPDGYSQVVSALQANATSSAQHAAYATFPASSPLSNGQLWVATGEEKALGLIPQDNYIDGFVGINNSFQWSYSAGITPPGGEYYLIGVLEHEFSEVMGRDSFLGDGINNTISYSPMDMFRYSAPGQRDLTATPPVANTAYFSINSGTTNLQSWNPNAANGDLGDWANVAKNDAYLAQSPSGQIDSVTAVDLELMNILGYQLSGSVSSGSALVVSGGATDYIYSGQTSSGTEVLSDGVLVVLNGGTGSGTFVSGGGSEIISGGGVDVGASISGAQYDFGVASGVTLTAGSQIVEANGVASGTAVSSGSTETVAASGSAVGATVFRGGILLINAGAFASGSTLESGSIDEIAVGGREISATVAGEQIVFGSAVGTVLSSGGSVYVGAEGVISGATASAGQVLQYGNGFGTQVKSGGFDFAEVGGTDAGATISSGGEQIAYGSAVATDLLSGGSAYIASGAVANGLIVSSGGLELDYGGASGTQVKAGGIDAVEIGGSETGATVTGEQIVFGSASGTTVSSGGTAYIVAGGLATTMTVSSNGLELDYGRATGTQVNVNAIDAVEVSGSETSAMVMGEQIVFGSAAGTMVSSGGTAYIVAGGMAGGMTVSSGGLELDYGSASGTQVEAHSIDAVEVGGSEISVMAAGEQIIFGSATGTTVLSGGTEYIVPGSGIASGSVISGGGLELDYGSASGTVVLGLDAVEVGGSEAGATVSAGGEQVVYGTASGITIAGGFVDVVSGATVSGTVTFVGAGELGLAHSQVFGGLVAGFSSTTMVIDLQDIAYVSGGSGATTANWAQVVSGTNGSGTLMVSGGGHVANIALIGQYVTSNFALSSDGLGGTFVTDPPITQTDSASILINPKH